MFVDAGLMYPGVTSNPATWAVRDGGPAGVVTGAVGAVPPATEAIASGVAVSLGGTGYVVVGPLPAKASGDGSLRKLNMLPLPLRQPAEMTVNDTHVVSTKIPR
jgi:hypothetical protein